MPDPQISFRYDGAIIADVGNVTRLVVPADGPVVPMQDPFDNGYPDVIVDQRRGYHNLETESVEEVVDYWQRWLESQDPPKEMIETGLEIDPYINAGRWVADCLCGGGLLCWDRNPSGCCLSCGRVYSVRWQNPQLRSEVIRTLACRPPDNMNWDPRLLDERGDLVETVAFLQRENLLMLGKAF